MKPLIIIGSGMAGITVAREFRKLDQQTPLLIITADDGSFYAKPMLSNAFAQGKQAEQLRNQSASQIAAQLNATILQHTQVTQIDTQEKIVLTDSGEFAYEKLVIASGAKTIQLNTPGDAANQVLSINHLNDYTDFRQRLEQAVLRNGGVEKTTIAIIGAGLIGCEFADDLAGAGYPVHVIDPNNLPLAALTPNATGERLAKSLRQRGVALHLGNTVKELRQHQSHLGKQVAVYLNDGEKFIADIVISAVGLRPNLDLANKTLPLALSIDRGILVDGYGETSASDVYALGDCAQYTDVRNGSLRVLPYIAPIMNAARAIAKTLTGQSSVIDLNLGPILVKTNGCPIALVAPSPSIQLALTWQHEELGQQFISRGYDQSGNLQAFAISHHDAKTRAALMAEMTKT